MYKEVKEFISSSSLLVTGNNMFRSIRENIRARTKEAKIV